MFPRMAEVWARFVVSATTVLRVLESLDLLPTFLRVVDEDEVVVVVDVEVVLWQKTRWWRKFENGASGRSLSGTSRVWPMSEITQGLDVAFNHKAR